MESIGKRISLLRKERNWSQQQLADRIGVSRSTVANYEQETREPQREQREALCDVFNVDMNYLHGISDIRNSCRYTTDIFSFLTDEEMEKVITYARFIYESRK